MQIKNIPRSPTSGQEKVNATLPADRFFDEVRKQRLDDRRRSAAVEAPAEHGIVLAAFPVAGPMMAEQPALLSAAQAGSAATHAAATAHQGLAQATVADQAPVGASMTVVPANGYPGHAERAGGSVHAVAIGENKATDGSVAHAAAGVQHGQEGAARLVAAPLPGTGTMPAGPQLSGREPGVHVRGTDIVSDVHTSAPAGALPFQPAAQSMAVGDTPLPARQAQSMSPQPHAYTTLQRDAAPQQAGVSRASETSAAFSYAFSSWGSQHVVRVNMGSTRTTVQASSQLVDDGLRRTGAVEGVDVIGIDVGPDDQSPGRERRGRQRRGEA